MQYVLLDVVAGSELIGAIGGVLIFMLGCILVEALVLYWLKCVPTFKNAFIYSVIANVVTMLLGFLIVPKLEDAFLNEYRQLVRILVYFAASFLVEFLVLLLLVKNTSLMRLLLGALLMNIVSYGLLIAIFIRDF